MLNTTKYEWPDFTVDNKANEMACEEFGLTGKFELTISEISKIAVRAQEIKNILKEKK